MDGCVGVREREGVCDRERVSVCGRESERQRKCVCVCERERVSVCERERKCVCVRECVREGSTWYCTPAGELSWRTHVMASAVETGTVDFSTTILYPA